MEENKVCLPGPPKIYAAIAGVINDIGVVSKDKINKQQGFKYRSVDDVYSVLNPALAKMENGDYMLWKMRKDFGKDS